MISNNSGIKNLKNCYCYAKMAITALMDIDFLTHLIDNVNVLRLLM